MPTTPSRVPSYGPNGTHWPGQVSGLITPFMYDETVPNKIQVAPTFTAIAAAINALTPAQVSAGVLIQVQPGTLVGGGGSSQSPLSLNTVGDKTWTKRVTVCPRDGFGTVTISNGLRIDKMRNICLAGFVIDGKLRIQSSTRFAFAWCVVNGNIAVSGVIGAENDPRQWEFVEFVKRAVFIGDSTDPMQLQSFDNLGKTLDGLVQDGCYYAPNYMNNLLDNGLENKAHQDTIQHFSFDSNAFFSDFVYRDTAIFCSNRCAVNGGLRNGVFRNCWLNGRRETQMSRYPDTAPTRINPESGVSQGTKANITFDGGIVMGSLSSNGNASPNPYPTVLNGAKIDYQPSGSKAPLNGSWVVDRTMDGANNPGYPPLPTDAYLVSIWGGVNPPPTVSETSQPSFDRVGTYYQSTTLSMFSATPNASIYYTTNGSTPTDESTLYTGPITVSATTTFQAIAIGEAPLTASNVVTATIAITNDLLSSTNWQNIPLESNLTDDFSITWRTTPSAAAMDSVTGLSANPASAYTQLPIIVRYNTSNGFDAMNGSAYAVTNAVPYTAGTEYEVKVDVRLSTKTYDVTVTPRPGGVAGTPVILANNFAFRTSAGQINNIANLAMLSASGSHTISTVEINEGDPVLEVAAAPTFSTVQPGNYATPQNVTLATTEVGATIRYNIGVSPGDVPLDGLGGFEYLGPIQLGNATLTIKARAFVDGKQPSEQIQGTFGVETLTVDPVPVEVPTISPLPLIFETGLPPQITITPHEAGHVIYYTLDGSTPTTASTLYTAPFTLPNAATLVTAVSTVTGRPNSPAVSSYYKPEPAGFPPRPPGRDDGSDPGTEPSPGVTEILAPQTYLSRARFLTKLTLTQSGTLAFGGLATNAASKEEDVIAGWKLNGTYWQVLDGAEFFNTAVLVQPGIWEVRIDVKQRNYSIYIREEGDDAWTTLGESLILRFRGGIDRTIYKSTMHPITIQEIKSQPFRIVLL